MTTPKIETEVKFIIPDAAAFASLKEITRLGEFELKRTGTQNIVDRYVDTADKRLYQANFACRIRAINREKKLLTLKGLTRADSHIHRRQEIEIEIESDQPHTWTDREARQLVLENTGSAPLETLFTIYQTRHKSLAYRGDRPLIEFSLDEISWDNPTTIDSFELEAELLEAGTEADLALFTEKLQSNWPLQSQVQSKFEQAWARINVQDTPQTDV